MKLLQILVLLTVSLNSFSAEGKPLNFEEVLSVIRTNMTDLSEGELSNSAAVGLIKELGTKVQLVTTNAQPPAESPDPISKTAVYQDKFGYIRIKSVDQRLTNEFHRTVTQLLASNRLSGLVLDLRYAGGASYEAAAVVADEFVRGGEPLIRLGETKINATDRAADIRQPVAVLVNGQTRAAAEAIAGILRESAAALVIGSRSAGEARLYEIFTLSTGQKLRVGKVPVVVGDGKVIPSSGIVPDIEVAVSPEEERQYYQDPYRERKFILGTGGTNQLFGASRGARTINEATLVREHRDGFDFEEETPSAAPELSVITDPTLARALDFLKGISILQPRR